MLGVILLEMTQESRFAKLTIEELSLMPERGTVTSGHTDTPGPTKLMIVFVDLTRSST